MTSKGIQTILESHRNQIRINQLEQLIPMQEEAFSKITPAHCVYQQMKNRIEELKLEYKERTGREYDVRNS